MNSIIVEPSIVETFPSVAQDLTSLARDVRLSINVHTTPNLLESIEEARAQDASTVIAYGGFDWFDRVISEMCREFVNHSKEPPIFGHIPPLKLPKILSQRVPAAYTNHQLKQSLQQIAARKIITKPAFHCDSKIWFTHSLKLEAKTPQSAPSKFFLHTPSGSKIIIQTPIQEIDIVTVELPDTDSAAQSAHLTVSAIASSLLTTSGNNLLEDNTYSQKLLKTHKPSRQPSEKAFQALADSLAIHATSELYSAHFDRTVSARAKIDSAQFAIHIIAEKNTVGKY